MHVGGKKGLANVVFPNLQQTAAEFARSFLLFPRDVLHLDMSCEGKRRVSCKARRRSIDSRSGRSLRRQLNEEKAKNHEPAPQLRATGSECEVKASSSSRSRRLKSLLKEEKVKNHQLEVELSAARNEIRDLKRQLLVQATVSAITQRPVTMNAMLWTSNFCITNRTVHHRRRVHRQLRRRRRFPKKRETYVDLGCCCCDGESDERRT